MCRIQFKDEMSPIFKNTWSMTKLMLFYLIYFAIAMYFSQAKWTMSCLQIPINYLEWKQVDFFPK
jgi:peptidoglycan/LPS O-acetylase OafA/YrhL